VKSRHKDAMPLIITHGWPGSVIEMLDVIGPLTDPTAYGGAADEAFDLVVPSLPGFGFSAQPTELGWTPGRVARAWAELMQRSVTRAMSLKAVTSARTSLTSSPGSRQPASPAFTSTSSARSRSKSGRRSLADFCRPVFSRGW